jgi:hypothetical protein
MDTDAPVITEIELQNLKRRFLKRATPVARERDPTG